MPAVVTSTARAGVLWLYSCSHLADNGQDTDLDGLVWQASAGGDYALYNRCPQGGSFQIVGSNPAKDGELGQWATVTPPAIQIVHAQTPVNDVLIDPNIKSDGYQASFFWNGGTQTISPMSNCCGGMYYGAGIDRWLGPSRWFGFQVSCQASPCYPPYGQLLDVSAIELLALDSTQPDVAALGSNNLWYQGSHYVRGQWPASFLASADDGICNMQAVVDGQTIQGPTDPTPNQHSWTQCPTPVTMNLSIDTTKYADGQLSLADSASDAANPANVSSPSETLQVDNAPVTLSLAGPTDAPSTAGTQYVTASASAGPSGVADIDCSEDGSSYQRYPGASAQVPVTGIGRHQVVCYAQNNALDPDGNAATSPTQMWTLTIREPTAIEIGFAHMVDGLRCHRSHERTAVRKRGRARVKTIEVMRCHPRVVRRKATIWSTVRRDGTKMRIRRTKTVRVVLPPHIVEHATRHVPHGRGTTVSGWLGASNGDALSGQPVWVLIAPDNGQGHFRLARTVTTRPDGTWVAHLRAGPSRLVKAVYPGTSTTEPTVSRQVRLIVPARVRLISVWPRRVPWGGTVRIVGRLLGGFLPSSGALVRLRIGLGSHYTTYGVAEHVAGGGRFTTTYTFGAGDPSLYRTFWFQVASLPMGDYPYAPSASRRVDVTIGGHPAIHVVAAQ